MKFYCIRLFIRLLLAYLDITPTPRDPKMGEWLADAWMTPAFRSWLAYREQRIIFELSGGKGVDPLTRDDYIRAIGHRLENLAFGFHACPSSDHLRQVRPTWKRGLGVSVEQVKRPVWRASSVCFEWSVV